MVRIDAWEVTDPEEVGTLDCGFPRDFDDKYTWGKQLGKGGFGIVRVVVEKRTGKEFACKSIGKHLEVPNFSPQRQAAHMENIKREVAVLRRLQGTLNVAQLKEAREDNICVHIIMEYCRGGELWNYIGKLHHYSERTVASYMRAVLRTVVQCHNQKILHRDIKPGNFMLLEDDPLSPVKAIDFGLAVFFEPGNLPRRDLGLEGTPWFMSPETLSSQVGPPADVWAVGVMAYQLLSGHLPFDDRQHPDAPALSRVWKAILTEEVVFKSKAWREVSEPAKDFVRHLLAKNPAARPTAKEALQHPWLVGGRKEERNVGAPLRNTVIQRVQRFGQGNVLKRTIFELIAQEIIKAAPETPDTSNHSQSSLSTMLRPGSAGKREADGSSHASQRAAQLVSTIKRRKSQRALAALAHGPGGGAIEGPPLIHREHHSVHGGLEYFAARGDSVHNGQQALQQLASAGRPGSVHGRDDYWRLLNAALEHDSVRGKVNFLRPAPRCDEDRQEHRKVARLALDTSKRNSRDYTNFLKQCSSPSMRRRSGEEGVEATRQNSRQLLSPVAGSGPSRRPAFPVPDSHEHTGGSGEERVRGRSNYRMFIESQAGVSPPKDGIDSRQWSQTASPSQSSGAATPQGDEDMRDAGDGSVRSGQKRHVSFAEPSADVSMDERSQGDDTASPSTSLPPGVYKELRDLMRKLNFTRESEAVSEEQLAEGLHRLGYDLKPDEVKILAERLEPSGQTGGVSKSAFLASQIDWYREDLRELWMEAARKVFAELERDSQGKISAATLMSLVREKVPEAEVEYAVEDALMDAGYADAEELDFDAFLHMLRPASSISLDQFEPRISLPISQDNLQPHLSTVAEET